MPADLSVDEYEAMLAERLAALIVAEYRRSLDRSVQTESPATGRRHGLESAQQGAVLPNELREAHS